MWVNMDFLIIDILLIIRIFSCDILSWNVVNIEGFDFRE